MAAVRFLFVIFFTFHATAGFEHVDKCANREITVNGVLSLTAAQLFTSSTPITNVYETERGQLGRKVSFVIEQVTPVTWKAPITFQIVSNNGPVDNLHKFPIVASSLSVIYNMPETSNLTLSITNLVYMYNGGNSDWNNTYLQRNNPTMKLPNKSIKLIARMDPDSSTSLFTQLLSASNNDWNRSYGIFSDPKFVDGVCCNSTKWPRDIIHMYANMTVGMVGVVSSVPYSLGYATESSLKGYSINRATLILANSGKVVKSNLTSVQAAISFYMNNSRPDDLLLNLDTTNATNVYPLTAFAYFVVNKTYHDVDCCIIEELVGFLDWFLFNLGDDRLANYKYTPLINDLKLRIKRLVLETITCDGELVYPKYLASKEVRPRLIEIPAWETAVIAVAVCLFTFATSGLLFYVYRKKYYCDDTKFIVDSKMINVDKLGNRHFLKSASRRSTHIYDDTKFQSVANFDPSFANGSFLAAPTVDQEAASLKDRMIIGEFGDTKVYLNKLKCRFPQYWTLAAKRLVSRMKSFENRNVSSLIGITALDLETYSIYEHSPKGTLHYVLRTTGYSINDDIKYQFAIDVSSGMKFLHQCGMVHGQLSSLACYLDYTWTVKVSQWEQMSLYTIENPNQLLEMVTYKEENIRDEEDLIKFVYLDPELRRSFDTNVDIYSFGMLLIEIFTRKLPYESEINDGLTSYAELFMKKFHRNINLLPSGEQMPEKVFNLSGACMSRENHRPSFQKICSELKQVAKISTGIIDIVMNSLERHAQMLEEKVVERTAELQEVTRRMQDLLNEVLPQQIASKLLKGEPVPPEYFECVTIYFSDIVGFTLISARSTPIQVMTLLNDLWTMFDSLIDQYDVYKVDTIGDAYMVCSGLPVRNGMDHCQQICRLSVELLDKCSRFAINHLEGEVLKIRIGVNSGPVTAGVVGSKMPQYCLFGDTVNTAARMESTSHVNRVQISSFTNQLIQDYFPYTFCTEHRGEICVKGKGNMQTYWLIGSVDTKYSC